MNFRLAPIKNFTLTDYPAHRIAIFSTGRILLNDAKQLPRVSELTQGARSLAEVFDNAKTKVKTALISPDTICLFAEVEIALMLPLRDAFSLVSDIDFQILLAGVQLAQWSETHVFCAGCGSALVLSTTEVCKHCSLCRRNFYPLLTPAIIVLVHRENEGRREVLLARGLPPRKFHSCLAGFVEAGETFEQTVRREVFEEAGVQIKNLKYFGSQPWPFPSQVMVGFLAEWQSGEIKIDPSEITEAGWYHADNLPELPISKSIARQMIDHVTKGGRL